MRLFCRDTTRFGRKKLIIFLDRWIDSIVLFSSPFSLWETSARALQAPSRRTWASRRTGERRRSRRPRRRPRLPRPCISARLPERPRPRPPRLPRPTARSASSAAAPSQTPGSSSTSPRAASSPSSSSPGLFEGTRCRRSSARWACRRSSAPRARGWSRSSSAC